MTKIAIISQAEQGVLIDISGCSSLSEAKQYLTSTLQVSSQFWEGLIVDLNLGPLVLTPEQVNEIQAIVSDVGVQPRQIFSHSPITRAALVQCRLPLGVTSKLQGYAGTKEAEAELTNNKVVTQEIAAALQSEISAHKQVSSSTATLPAAPEWNDDSYAGVGLTPLNGSSERNGPDEPFFRSELARKEAAQFKSDELEAAIPSLAISSNATPEVCSQQAQVAVHLQKGATAPSKPQAPAVLMMKQTLRSGQRVCHKGHLVIIGDVNPGAELVADGDITVWGALRGMAHAGASGNTNAEIRALKFEPIQLRIAHAIARSPDRNKPGNNFPSGPETARVVDGKIRIAGSEPD